MSDLDRLGDERARVAGIVESLRREFDEIVATAALGATDDEHDPEGSTIAFERQRVAALLRDAEAKLVALDDALGNVAAGHYGICVSCAKPIGAERLEALPAARSCIACAESWVRPDACRRAQRGRTAGPASPPAAVV